ncbi:MAG: IclR family transcriptional regulator, partial [Saezia sp.]
MFALGVFLVIEIKYTVRKYWLFFKLIMKYIMTSNNQKLTTKKTEKKNTIQGAQAFHRAIKLLKLVANNNQKGMRLIDIAHLTGLTIPTTHRLLQALVAEKLLYKIENSNLYAIGALVYELGFTAKRRFNLLQIFTPIVEILARKTSSSAVFCIKSDDDLVCMIKADNSSGKTKYATYTGQRTPLGICASGVALLSALTPHEQQEIIQRNLAQYDLYFSIKQSEINEYCEDAQKNGYAVMRDPLDADTLSVAIPVLNN